MLKTSPSYNFLWMSIALLPLVGIALLLPLQPHDYWWYLRLGKETLLAGNVPIVDTFSAIQTGQPIVYQSWLSAVIFWLVYQTGGIPLTFFIAAVLISITYMLLWNLIRQAGVGARLTTFIVLLAGLSGSNNWSIRPQLFAYPLFLAALWALFKWQNREDKYLWLLVPLGLAWANLHGSFILMFAPVGIALIFGTGDRKKLFWAALAALSVTLINPRGFILWISVLDTFISPSIRNLSPEWLAPRNEGWQLNIFFAWLLALAPLAAFARRRASAFEWMLFLAFSWLALTGLRYVIWDLFIIAILSGALMPESIVKRFDKIKNATIPALNYGIGAVFLIMPFIFLPGARVIWWKDAPPALARETPVAAAAWLAKHSELRGVMWNDVVFGSYLMHAAPDRPVSMDTRIQVIYTSEQAVEYLFVQSAQDGWEERLKDKGINLLFLARYQTVLVEAVQRSGQWCLQYQDETALIFSRCAPLP